MKRVKTLAVTLLVLLTSAHARAQEAERPRKPSKVEQQILTLDRAWADAMVRGDVASLDGGAAVLTGHAKWRINYKGRDIDNERRYTSVYAKRGGRWRMVALQLTRLTPPPQKQQ